MIIVLLLGILLVSVLWEGYFRYWWSREIVVKLWFDTDAVYAGQETKLYEMIENRKTMPVPVLEVGFHTRKELVFVDVENTNVSDFCYKRDVFSVLGWQKITRVLPVRCTKRGKYVASDADIMTHTLLYRKRYTKDISTEAVLYVYPKMTDVSEIMTVCESLLGTLQCAKQLYEDPFAFRSIRDYTMNDPMKSINWKASARTDSLMVNTFDSVRSQKAMIFLDVEDRGILRYESLVEESIALAATLFRKLSRQGTDVGFVYNGNSGQANRQIMLPENNRGKLIAFERMLAEYDQEEGAEAFEQLLQHLFEKVFVERPLTGDTLCLFITKNLNDALFEQIRTWAGEQQTLIVVPVYSGEKTAGHNANIKSKDNVQVLIKEVERA